MKLRAISVCLSPENGHLMEIVVDLQMQAYPQKSPKRYFEISWTISGRYLNIISPFLWYRADKLMFKCAETGHSK